MKKNENILNEISKAPLPEVPENFFEYFSEDLVGLLVLEHETEGLLDDLHLNRFKSDLNSVQGIDIENLNSLHSDSGNKLAKRPKTRYILLWAGAVAASLTLLFTWPDKTDSTVALVENQLTEDVILAYLDEADLVEYIVDFSNNQASETEVVDDIFYEALEDEIYNYINDI